MNFSDLLKRWGIRPEETLMMRHSARQDSLKKALPILAIEQPAVFNAYQQAQKVREENQLERKEYLASFIGHEPKKALFVGLYQIGPHRRITRRQFEQIPENRELERLGMKPMTRASCLWFYLIVLDRLADWQGRITIKNWNSEISFSRPAANKEYPVTILKNNALLNYLPSRIDGVRRRQETLSKQPTLNISEIQEQYDNLQIKLGRFKKLDEERRVFARKEQVLLRSFLFRGRELSTCFLCGERLPITLLVAAHIKKRANCSEVEKRDLSNIVPMCLLGCDALFERRYLAVVGGRVSVRLPDDSMCSRVPAIRKTLHGRKTLAYKSEQEEYFRWHAEQIPTTS